MGKQWKQWLTLFCEGSKITADGDCSHEIKDTPWKESYDQPRQHVKKAETLSTKFYLVKAMVYPVVMYGCESWTIKKAERQRIDAFERWFREDLESPVDCKEIQPVHPKGYQSWVFIGRSDVEAEAPILWPPDAKNWLIWKDPNDGWMPSPTQWTWVWVKSRSWWWTGRLGTLQSMGAESDVTERLNWTDTSVIYTEGCSKEQ